MLGTARLTGQTLGAMLAAVLFSVWAPHPGSIGPAIALAAGAVFALLSGGCSVLRVPAARRP